jgi:hypothetical protein
MSLPRIAHVAHEPETDWAHGKKKKKRKTLKNDGEMHSRCADIFNCYSSIRRCADEGGGVEI